MLSFLKSLLPLAGMILVASAWGQTATPPPPVSITLTPPAASSASATTAPAAPGAISPAASVTSTPKSVVAPPIPPPPSVPDNVNPFADKKNLPKPLSTINISCTPMNADIHSVNADGMSLLRFFLDGPDFQWEFDALDDWTLATKGAGESFAFIYKKDPTARLSFSLYGAKEFMPDISPSSIILYLAAVRENDPDGFILTTPVTKDEQSLPFVRFGLYGGQGVTYATTSPALMLHHDWFADLNGEYQFVVKLTSPPALMSRLEAQLGFTFTRAVAHKGLGVDVPPPSDTPPADTAKSVSQ